MGKSELKNVSKVVGICVLKFEKFMHCVFLTRDQDIEFHVK
jgi:hypothetical protein